MGNLPCIGLVLQFRAIPVVLTAMCFDPTRTKDRRKPSRRHWESALHGEQDMWCSIRAAAKQLVPIDPCRVGLLSAVPYHTVPELDLKRPSKGRSGPEPTKRGEGDQTLLCAQSIVRGVWVPQLASSVAQAGARMVRMSVAISRRPAIASAV
jgi:hypothetical protein